MALTIKRCNIMTISRGINTKCLYHCATALVISKNGCVVFVLFACDCQRYIAWKSIFVLVSKVLILWPIQKVDAIIKNSPIWLVPPTFRWCPQKPVYSYRMFLIGKTTPRRGTRTVHVLRSLVVVQTPQAKLSPSSWTFLCNSYHHFALWGMLWISVPFS